jgi:O-antigen/teichoic acid export membrane protein
VQLAVTIVMIAMGVRSIVVLAIPFVVKETIALIVAMIGLRSVVRVRPRVDLAQWGVWLREAAPLALGAAISTIYFRVDTLLLSKLDSTRAVGVYQIGYKFADLLAFVAPALLGVLLPLLVSAWPSATDRFRATVRQSLLLFAVISAFACVSFAVFSRPAIESLFGSTYASSSNPARILVAGQALNLLSQLAFVILVAVGRRREYLMAATLGLAVNVALNIALIPGFSASGSATATVITEVVVLAVLARALVDLPIHPLPWRSLGVVVAAAATSAATMLAVRDWVPWPAAMALAGVPYLGALHVLRVDGPGGLPALVANSRAVVATTDAG